MFIIEDFMTEILNQTNIYSQQKNVSLNVTKHELSVVFGAFLLSGYAKYSNKRLYSSREDGSSSILSKAIQYRRFKRIIYHFCFNGNSRSDPNNRFYKLKPLLDHLTEKFLDLGVIEEHHLIDEFMIP